MKRNSALLCVAIVGLAALFAWNKGVFDNVQDVQVYRDIAAKVVQSQYPPLATSLFIIAGLAGTGSFLVVWGVMIIASIIAAALYARFVLQDEEFFLLPFGFLAVALVLGSHLIFARFDVFVGLLLFLAWRAHRHKFFAHSAAFLFISISLKLVPVLFLPLLWYATPKPERMKLFKGGLVGIVLSFLVPLLVLGLASIDANVGFLLKYHAGRGIQIESMWSGIDMLWHNLHGAKIPYGYDALAAQNMNLGIRTLVFSAALLVGGLLYLFWRARKTNPQKNDLPALLLCAFFWMMAVSPVLSPQYFVWLMPLAFVWLWERFRENGRSVLLDIEAVALVAIGLLTQWIFPYHYGAFLDQTDFSLVIALVVRNVLLLVLAVAFLLDWTGWRLRRKSAAAAPHRSRLWTLVVSFCWLIAGMGLMMLLFQQAAPIIGEVIYSYDKGPIHKAEALPLFVPSAGKRMEILVLMQLPPLHPTVFHIKPDDCLLSLDVNGVNVPDPSFPYCDDASGKAFNLRSYLQSGFNQVHFVVQDNGGLGGINMSVNATDPLILIGIAIIIAMVCWFLWVSASLFIRHPMLLYSPILGKK